MNLVLPSTVEEINFLQNSPRLLTPHNMYVKESNKGFENIWVEKRYKREVSLPNGVQNWNISNFDPYLNFDDNIQTNNFVRIESPDDSIVPQGGELRPRSESISSVSSSVDEKFLVYENLGVKTYNTIHMDSGSTCITADHSYVNTSSTVLDLDAGETYQNLDTFLKQVPDLHVTDSISSVSSIGSPMNDSNLDYSTLGNSYSVASSCSQDSFHESHVTLKRNSDTPVDELFSSTSKHSRDSSTGRRYFENRKKNNIASKNCRKTRKEKQKEMDTHVLELEKEREGLLVEVQVLEELVKAHKHQLYAILQNR